MTTARDYRSAPRVRAANGRRIDARAFFAQRHGCLGNCQQGRRACTLPGVCGAPAGQWLDTVPAAPAPAEACTEIGVEATARTPAQHGRHWGLSAAGWFWCAYFAALFATPWLIHACSAP